MSDPRRTFWVVLWGTLLLKLALAAWLPLTGDEAYFYLWGKYPALGYYDHPPMIGWFLHLLLYVSDANWWLRLPAILLTTVIGWGIYRWLERRIGARHAALVGVLYLLTPLNVVAVLVTTDTLLILFCFLSVLALVRALESDGYRWFVASGALLGLAFLSKYFAVLLGVGYGVYLLLVRRSLRNAVGLLLLFLAVLPFASLNVWWNYTHCWDNILFNFYSRTREVGTDWTSPALYLLTLIYLATPPLLLYGWRRRAELWQRLRSGETFLWLSLLPLLLFAGLSLRARIGLHWVLAFYPLLFLALPVLFNEVQLRRSIRFMGGFTLLHLLFVAVVLLLPLSVWQGRPVIQHDLIFGQHTDEFWQRIAPHAEGAALATDSYVYSAMLERESGRHFAVFGDASKYGRQDDILTDYSALDGKNITVLLYAEQSVPKYAVYFDRHRVYPVTVRGTTDYLLVGEGFHYPAYRDQVLRRIQQQFYRLPWFLPCRSCYFYAKYFPDQEPERLPRP